MAFITPVDMKHGGSPNMLAVHVVVGRFTADLSPD
jgi:hypothetical protein